MRGILAWILGLSLAVNGVTMLTVPAAWYAAVPGVPETGPFNSHFVRDVGVAYLVAGMALTAFARDRAARPAALAGAAFLALHALVHLWDAAAGREAVHQLLFDVPLIFMPPVLAVWITFPHASDTTKQRRATMLKWFFKRWIGKFERTWNYDASYLRELVDIDPRAMLALGKVQAISKYRKGVPAAAYCAAGIVAVMSEDCGPCTQLGIDMAERSGVDPAVLRAIVARDFAAMPYKVALAARFTEATLRHAPEADDLREEVVRQFGKRGLLSLSFAMLAARIYPTLKYALGHGQACRRLTIGGETRPVLRDIDKANVKSAAA